MEWWIYPLIGALGGFIAGLLGIGGGVVITPLLMLVMQNPLSAIATSLAAMTVSTTYATSFHLKHKNIDLGLYRKLFPGLLIGSLMGAYLARETPQNLLSFSFGIFSVFFSFFFLFKVQNIRQIDHITSNNLIVFFIGFGIATIAAFLGIGGGIIASIGFFLLGYPLKKVHGITSLLSMTITWFGVLPLLNQINLNAFLYLAPICAIFAYIGLQIAKKLHSSIIEKIFGIFLLIIGLILLKPSLESVL
jgi:uncharacterized membrane protein YfcA